ncbi:hypothetical protein [Photobacterium sanguinicancri]|uniref:hypothetical protein n=1 Tax=Photobacterium sanguinicancri TaxID=875932 RepID=UPI003D14E909
MTRKNPIPKQRESLLHRNLNRCCVCKRAGVGLHLHHIDGNNSNTVEENIAVLCVEDHDSHHRPNKYVKPKHMELSAEKLLEYKSSWESFVQDAQSDSPSVLATINFFGNEEQVHAARLIFQWPNQKIEFEITYHLLEGNVESWIDNMILEVNKIGEKIKLGIVDGFLPIEYCGCGGGAYSHVVNEAVVTKANSENWDEESIMSVYINPDSPRITINLSLLEKQLFNASIHLCEGTHLHFKSDYHEERIKIKKKPSVRTQVTNIFREFISEWEPAHIFAGTGDPEFPESVDYFLLPICREKRHLTRQSR